MFTSYTTNSEPVLINSKDLQKLLQETAHFHPFPHEPMPVFLCIGTDRIIGDSLGPMVGTMLQKKCSGLAIYGTLHQTVHAVNFSAIHEEIKKKHPGRTVIAIDASLGTREHLGAVFIRPGSLKPGSGVAKNLPAAGDISITGIVGTESAHPYLDLQTVRLSVVTDMAEQICDCIFDALRNSSRTARNRTAALFIHGNSIKKCALPGHEATSLRQYTPDRRPPAHRWQSG